MFFFIPGVSREFSKNNFSRFLKIFFRAGSLPFLPGISSGGTVRPRSSRWDSLRLYFFPAENPSHFSRRQNRMEQTTE